ncbi:hypothetical protein NO2_1406 [Candidatus Termititenax persephonae]|uniref:Uncharacterized protein n=1 Tax=Candidatus Termititenax persephonae TaxID=2218525 RepID=A0A388TKB1_9BACT|nr:hypothetical protein NO2_1406 [Candidatus Termititenax persephonae]
MSRRKLASLSGEDTRNFEISVNKVNCAKQAARPGAVPEGASPDEAEKFIREAIFARADAQYLQDFFWRDLAWRYGIGTKDVSRLYVDFDAGELFLEEGA